MPDIELNGAIYPDVPAVELPLRGGGFATFVYGSGGTGFEHVGRIYDHTWTLAETDFATWTPSTTAKAIITGANAGTFTASNIVDNDYFSQWKIEINVAYESGTTAAKAMLKRVIGQNWYEITRRASNITNLNAGTRNSGIAESVTNTWIEYYTTSATAHTVAYSPAYGLYPVNVAPTFSSATAASPVITAKYPTINARTSTTYWSAAFCGHADQNASTIRMVCDIWRSTNVGYRRSLIYDELNEQWINGLSAT